LEYRGKSETKAAFVPTGMRFQSSQRSSPPYR
ncbi:hypothetical protein EVA_22611, partial [gut metagenome]